jgi:hypothetical protein
MTTVVVTEKALREMVREAMFNKEFAGWSTHDDGPATVNAVVDPSAAVTDPINPNFKPQTKTEFGVAVNQLVKNLPDTQMPGLFDTVKTAIDQKEEKEDEEDMEKQAAQGGTKQVEESVRKTVRQILARINPRWNAAQTLAEAKPPKVLGPVVGPLPPVTRIPAGVHGAEYERRKAKYQGDLKAIMGKPEVEEPEEAELEEPGEEPKKKRAYKKTAIGGMSDVSGASFEDIAKELGFSVAGAKQAVDKALEKAQFLAQGMDDDDREILILNSMNDYIKYLAKSDELSAADVQLMKDHPDIVRELDGFREFLHNAIRRQRKAGQKVEDPLGEDDNDRDRQIRMKSVGSGKEEPQKDASGNVTKAKSTTKGGGIEVDWGGLDEEDRPKKASDEDKRRVGLLRKQIGDKKISSVSYAGAKKSITHARVDGMKGEWVWNPNERAWEFVPELRG